MRFKAEGRERLDRFLARQMPEHSRTRVSQAIRAGLVEVRGVVVDRPSFELTAGEDVSVEYVPSPEPHNLEPLEFALDVRYEDDHLLVVNKPRGMATHPAPGLGATTLVNALLARSHALSTFAGDWRPGIVHRLDKETTGLLLVAKSDLVHRTLSEKIKSKDVVRLYTAVVFGHPDPARQTIVKPIGRHPGVPSLMTIKQGGREAATHFNVLQTATMPNQALVSCRLETGRTHQIRVHMSSIGHPVKGDRLYAKKPWGEGPMQLHASILKFAHPVTGEALSVYAEPPEDFEMEVAREEVEGWS